VADSKFRSRRFYIVVAIIANATVALQAGVLLLFLEKPIDGLGLLLGSFTTTASLALTAYGYSRSKWGAADDNQPAA